MLNRVAPNCVVGRHAVGATATKEAGTAVRKHTLATYTNPSFEFLDLTRAIQTAPSTTQKPCFF